MKAEDCKLKILITTGIFFPDIGGPASYSLNLGHKLAKDHIVGIVTYSPTLKEKTDKDLPFEIIRVWRKPPGFLRHFAYFLKVLFAARGYDVIYALNLVSAGVPAWLAAKILRRKFFVKIVGDYAWETAINKGKTALLINDFQGVKKRGWIRFLHFLQYQVARSANGIIVPSQYLAGIVGGWGVNPAKIRVIYNGIDFKPLDISREEARNRIGIHGSIILSAGRLVSWKGFKMLVKIMPQLLEINQFFRLVIVGGGPEYQILQSMAKNLGLNKRVFIVGKKSPGELTVYLAAADIFVLNTGYEGFSHQILEAMAAGVPVITTAVGGNKEIVRQGENGFLVKYNDEFNLIEAVKTLWQMPELRKQFAIEGEKTAKFFNADKMFEETITALNL